MRWAISIAMLTVGALLVVAVGPDTVDVGDVDRFAGAHALTGIPFLVIGLACTLRARRLGPDDYRRFWGRWFAASGLGLLASIAALVGAATHTRALLALDMALLVAATPLWVLASIDMVRANAGRRSVSIDVIDAASALVVLGTPGVLLVIEPLGRSENLLFAVPFAFSAVCAPGMVYLSTLNLARIPRGERASFGVGTALAGLVAIGITMQLARVLGGLDLPMRVFVAVHVVTIGLVAAIPLFAHRRAVGRLGLLPAHQQVRQASPMPAISAVALPVMGLYVYLTRDERSWGVWFFVAVILTVVALNALRYRIMSRETRRLYAGIARMAEERRRLLARMLRGLEDDRHRTATELHSQAIGSLATLGTLVQMAHVALPTDSALTVQQTIAQLQSDLGARAEHLRQLMLAIRPPPVGVGDGSAAAVDRLGPTDDAVDRPVPEVEVDAAAAAGADPPGAGDGLAAALLAYAAEQWSDEPRPEVTVDVDRRLRLDWTTMTIVYRIAQEALLNAARHARARNVAIAVAEEQGRILVEVRDDGVGFEPRKVTAGSGLATMELFTQLGEGELTLRSWPGGGTHVHSLLRPCPASAASVTDPPRPGVRHLRLIGNPAASDPSA